MRFFNYELGITNYESGAGVGVSLSVASWCGSRALTQGVKFAEGAFLITNYELGITNLERASV
jgi:hypothetical protein